MGCEHFQQGISVPFLPLSGAATVLSVLRAAATSSQLSASDHRKWQNLGLLSLGSSHACTTIVPSLWETGGTEWGASNRLPTGPCWGHLKKKKFPSPFPSLTLNLQFLFCAIFKSKIFLVEKRLCVIHFASFCHSKQHSKIKGVLGVGAVRCHHLSSQCAGTMQCLGWILSEERPRHSFQYSQCTTQYLRQTLISKELSKNIYFFCLLCPSWVMTGLLCSLKMRWKDSK